jgi:hypothetical protein
LKVSQSPSRNFLQSADLLNLIAQSSNEVKETLSRLANLKAGTRFNLLIGYCFNPDIEKIAPC